MQGFEVTDYSASGEVRESAQLLRRVAIARGCKNEEEVMAFLGGGVQIRNPISRLPAYALAEARLRKAIAKGETITIFGDYDVDGMTSLVLVFDLLRAMNYANVRLYVPDRASEDYGLTDAAVLNCLESQSPGLVFSVDCGSNSVETINLLKSRGVDAIILDHHAVHVPPESHPAVAHLNPKAVSGEAEWLLELQSLSAAGLAFLFCEQFAGVNHIKAWSVDRALILAGLGTLVDVMPLIGINRDLVRRAVELSNTPKLDLVPGLKALKQACKVNTIDARTFGFTFGPHLNAAGRVDSAKIGIRLLANRTSVESALPVVYELTELNKQRKETQNQIVAAALVLAQEIMLALPDTKVLLLAHKDWHIGIVGIVASRIREKFRLPTIICGMTTDGFWKGSGRSVPGFDLGGLVANALAAGVITSGGGHHQAAGVKMTTEQVEQFAHWLYSNTKGTELITTPTYEVLGQATDYPVSEWLALLKRLEPVGNGNPECHLILENAELVMGPTPLHRNRDGAAWAITATFQTDKGKLALTWTDIERAYREWSLGDRYKIVVSLSVSTGSTGREYINWRVIDAMRLEFADSLGTAAA